MTTITFLGTGSAMPSHSYNACLFIQMPGLSMLVDAGGGNEILQRLDKAGIAAADIHHFFITHTHTDHILGAVWVIRKIVYLAMSGNYTGHLSIYGNSDVIEAVDSICRLTYLDSYYEAMRQVLEFVEVGNNSLDIDGYRFDFFDVGSENVVQTGFRVGSLAFLGDEGLTERNMPQVAGASHLICGAFCRYTDRHIFHPYEKHHDTVLDIARRATKADIGNLILFHCEDSDIENRQRLYAEEGAEAFAGDITVPRDMTKVNICLDLHKS